MPAPTPFFLASRSPRRRRLLEDLEFPYELCVPVDTDEEDARPDDVEAVTIRNALRKAKAAREMLGGREGIVLAADTLVAQGDVVLGKPKDRDDARRMLQSLSARTHRVITGIALSTSDGKRVEHAESTWITFRALGAAELEAYLATKEPYDKAGSYAVQGLASLFVEKIDGSYSNVVGLPIEAMLRGLEKLTGRSPFSWR